MHLKCILGFHDWGGCKCARCEKIRDEDHSWSGTTGKRCATCGKARDDRHKWCGETRHKWVSRFRCSNCGALRNLTGMTVVASARSMQAPLSTAPERDRSFFCVSATSLDGKTYDGVYDGFWLIDGTKGTTAFFEIEKVLDETPAWVLEKYPRVASVVRS
jgi:hypothetical protein